MLEIFYAKRSHFMMCLRKTVFTLIVVLTAVVIAEAREDYPDYSSSSGTAWRNLEPGLEYGAFPSPHASKTGDSLIRVLRIDPRKFELRLFNTSAPEHVRLLTAKEWCQQNGLVAAINASMYQADRRTSVSLMRTKTHTNNPRLSKDMTILAFDRQSPDVPLVKIIDRQCEDFDAWKSKYETLVQSIRMISCKGKNVWSQQAKKWSTAAIGIDNQGKVLFIHVRAPFSTYDLINNLKILPIELSRLMYVEGGKEAQLYVQSGDQAYEFTGIYETGFDGSNQRDYAWSIPNVIGIVRRSKTLK